MSLAATSSPGTNVYVRAFAKGVRVVAARRQIEINLPAPAELVIRDVRTRSGSDIEVSFPLSLGSSDQRTSGSRRFHDQGHG